MPTLELLIDATGMQRGAQQAEAALRGVSTQAERTAVSVTSSGRALSNAFQTTQGVSQIGQGISQTALAFGQLNIAAGAFSASRTLLEIGKTAQDFQQMRAGITGASGAMATFGAVLRAHPLLTIATVIGAAASIMSVFSSRTRQTADSFDELGTAMQKAKLDQRAAELLGISAGPALKGQQSALLDQFAAGQNRQSFTLSEMAGSTGLDQAELLRYLAWRGNPDALEYMRTGQILRNTGGNRFGGGFTAVPDPLGEMSFTRAQATDIYRRQYESLGAQVDATKPPGREAPGGVGGMTAAMTAADAMVSAGRDVADSMREAANYAGAIGSSLGAATFDVLAGIQGWRAALANIIGQIGRQGLGSIGESIFRAGFGTTGSQAAASSPPGGMVGDPGSFGP